MMNQGHSITQIILQPSKNQVENHDLISLGSTCKTSFLPNLTRSIYESKQYTSLRENWFKTNQALSVITLYQHVILICYQMDQKISMSKIVDLDWQFGVTAASNIPSLRNKTFVQLKLTLDSDGKTEDLNLELNVQQFYKLMLDLEKARKDLNNL